MKVNYVNLGTLNQPKALIKPNNTSENTSINRNGAYSLNNYSNYHSIMFGNLRKPEIELQQILNKLIKKTGEITPKMIDSKIAKLLINVSRSASDKSYAPYSNFHVGAAVISKKGKIYKGCNVENASYGLTLCAERNTLSSMVAQDGHQQIAALACTAKEAGKNDVWPCGACRQWIEEFDKDETAKIIAEKNEKLIFATTKELLPNAFGPKDLNK
jgi:cytidine deaminase